MSLKSEESTVTLDHIRGHGYRDFIAVNPCSDGATLNADHMPGRHAIRPLGARIVCSRCGYRGVDVRPDSRMQRN
jgi:hypothetical protein